MFRIARPPFGTFTLTLAILLTYWALSSNTPYIASASLRELALNSGNAYSIITHLFVHVGIFHLIGNLIPLILFGLALEGAILSIDVVLIFLMAGTGASLLFSIINPAIPLIGASAGISGVLSSVMLLRPKMALALLIATPLAISFVVFPALDFAGKFYDQNLAEKKVQLSNELTTAVKLNQTPKVIMQLNQTLQKTEKQIEITQQGKQREASTPSDFLVHVYGAIIGGLYILFFKRKALKESEKEFLEIGGFIFGGLDSLSERLKGRKRHKTNK